ncbi:Monoacylglycerol lipase [Acaryochloris thomasi RCC1774]|uniref:Monoacylglycerol lipase n=1 Tax=Acaryochloris thomasi RCC1774 TaxID=1764569 RepID=A0A2W1JQ44_9CYAN|nr:alpha/beta hydrolase [Acaryochloris thomasi]PZD73535.1 Monoacylglycerol lipase [Acaryochloris thomasi RCC1774]
MDHHEGTFLGAGDLPLYYQSWHPFDLRAVVVAVHGLGAHSDRHTNLVKALMPQGYAVYAFDLRGHGRSPGQRAYINSWSEFRQDLDCFLKLVAEEQAATPCFLWGHSLGAMIVLDYVLQMPNELQGVIASALPIENSLPRLQRALGQVLSIIWPRFSLKSGLDPCLGSRDQAVMKTLLDDPLRHYQGTARMVTEFAKTADGLLEHASDLRTPLLMMHGGCDRIALPEGSQKFFERVTFTNKERYFYPESYHDLYIDLNYPEILADLIEWLERQLTPVAS